MIQSYNHINQILPTDRNDSNLFQKVKHYDELSGKGKRYIDEAERLVTQVKEDGVSCVLVVQPFYNTHRIGLFSRTGKAFTNVTHLVEVFRKDAEIGKLKAGVYFGELLHPDLTLEELSGLVNPNRTNPSDLDTSKLNIVWFDIITLTEYIDGSCNAPYQVRYEHLWGILDNLWEDDRCSSVGFTSLVKTFFCSGIGQARDIFEEQVSLGEEGVVIRNAEAPWVAGHKGHNAVKLVRSVSYDLLCIGAESGKGKREGLVAKLLFRWRDGKTLKADLGKGWTDGKRPSIEFADRFIGNIYRVYGLQDSSKGLIRLAKVGEERFDKDAPDF